MTSAQLRFILSNGNNGESSDKIKENIESFITIGGFTIHTGRYDNITIDWGNELIIIGDTDEDTPKHQPKQYISFESIIIVREYYNVRTNAEQEVQSWLSM